MQKLLLDCERPRKRWTCLVVTVLRGEEQEASSNIFRSIRQERGWSLSGAPPWWHVVKASQFIETNLCRCGNGEETRQTLQSTVSDMFKSGKVLISGSGLQTFTKYTFLLDQTLQLRKHRKESERIGKNQKESERIRKIQKESERIRKNLFSLH